MRIIAVIDEAAVIRKILKHLRLWDPLPEITDYPPATRHGQMARPYP